jgi:hypothetical protein
MFAFLSSRFRRWLLVVIALPLIAWALDRLGLALQQRRKSPRLASSLRRTSGWLRSRNRPRRRKRLA